MFLITNFSSILSATWEFSMHHMEGKWIEMKQNIEEFKETYNKMCSKIRQFKNCVSTKYNAYIETMHGWIIGMV